MNVRITAAPVSEESELIREIESLIDKFVAGTATDSDKRRYLELSKRRVDLMQPAYRGGHERRREKVA